MIIKIQELDYTTGEITKESIITDTLTLFVWDDCHKIYLVQDHDDVESVKSTWGEDTLFYTIDELQDIYDRSCPLRFISNWKLDTTYARQCYNARIIMEDI